MMAYFPADNMESLLDEAEEIWYECSEYDWKEAFAHHPKIGDVESMTKKFTSTAQWASGEQSGVNVASKETIEALAAGNRLYLEKFGYIFIVCATGKSAAEQNKITKLRLEKLLDN